MDQCSFEVAAFPVTNPRLIRTNEFYLTDFRLGSCVLPSGFVEIRWGDLAVSRRSPRNDYDDGRYALVDRTFVAFMHSFCRENIVEPSGKHFVVVAEAEGRAKPERTPGRPGRTCLAHFPAPSRLA